MTKVQSYMILVPHMTMETSNMRKIKEPLNLTRVQSHVMLILNNVRIKPLNVRKKIREPPNVTKELSNVMLELLNVMMEKSNMRKKETTKYEKRTVTFNIGTA